MIEPIAEDLGCTTNIAVINRFVTLQGKFVVDVGCGNMDFTRQLAESGARVLAIDPDPVQAELNRHVESIPGVEFLEGGADAIPLADHGADGVFFAYSLHHIPEAIYEQVFQEVFRVLKPEGFLFVIEPIDCPLNQVMRHFHNEDRERAAAQAVLEEIAVPAFQTVERVTYHSFFEYDSFDHFAKRFGSRSFNTLYSEEDVRREEVREAFEQQGGPDYRFQSPKLVMCLKSLKKS